MSMSDWDLVEQAIMIIIGAGWLWLILAGRGRD